MRLVEEVRICDGCWQGFPSDHLFSLWMRYAIDAFLCQDADTLCGLTDAITALEAL